MKTQVLTWALIVATVLSGFEIIYMTRTSSLIADYNLFAGGDGVFNSKDSNQHLIYSHSGKQQR